MLMSLLISLICDGFQWNFAWLVGENFVLVIVIQYTSHDVPHVPVTVLSVLYVINAPALPSFFFTYQPSNTLRVIIHNCFVFEIVNCVSVFILNKVWYCSLVEVVVVIDFVKLFFLRYKYTCQHHCETTLSTVQVHLSASLLLHYFFTQASTLLLFSINRLNFFGAFTKLWRATISFFMPIHMSVSSAGKILVPTGQIFLIFDIWGFFKNPWRKFTFH